MNACVYFRVMLFRLRYSPQNCQLWQYFLSHNGTTQLIAANLAARNQSTDLGEFDLIYKHPHLGIIHLEIACKYYLAKDQQTEDWTTWLGPGKTDRLDLKLNHTLHKQINLADKPIACEQLFTYIQSQQLAPPSQDKLLTKQLFIGGRLFYRLPINDILTGQSLPRLATPKHLNSQHPSGHWLLLSEWYSLINAQTNGRPLIQYNVLEKAQWLDSATSIMKDWEKTRATTKNSSERQQASDKAAFIRTPALAVYSGELTNGQARFCFIVADNWLAQ